MVQKESPIPSSSDKSHVIRTSAQWDSSGDQYHVIPRGVISDKIVSDDIENISGKYYVHTGDTLILHCNSKPELWA
jgi:hypothetical protein